MAYCKDCSINTFGRDSHDFSGFVTREEFEETGEYVAAVCEGCGVIGVDHNGKRVQTFSGRRKEIQAKGLTVLQAPDIIGACLV